jgi:hypothetical protein
VLRLEGIIGSEGGFRRSSSASQLLPNRAGFGVLLDGMLPFLHLGRPMPEEKELTLKRTDRRE